jgi:hypothetical protein
MSVMYRLTTVDGDEVHVTPARFFADNEVLVGTGVEDAIRALYVGGEYGGGGGAQPAWTIRRVA